MLLLICFISVSIFKYKIIFQIEMKIKDLSWNDEKTTRFNNPLLPRSIRGLIVGKSASGKTTMLLNLLLNPGWLDYDNLQVFGRSLFQPEYKILRKAFEEKLPKEAIIGLFGCQDEIMRLNLSPTLVVEEMAKNLNNKSAINCQFYETSEDVPNPRDLSRDKKILMIFDDLQLENQNKCESYYIRGRHSNVDCFYLAKNYFKLPRQTIRENTNFICLFPQDLKNINNIYKDHVGADDMSKEEFTKLCKSAWGRPHGFVVIAIATGTAVGVGLLIIIGRQVSKKLVLKVAKHQNIKTLAEAKLYTISSLISKALVDDNISDEEYSLILNEFVKFNEMKEEIRSKSKLI